VEAIDHLTGMRCAIKKVADVFSVFENAKRIFREVHTLRQMNHPNVIRLLHLQQPADLLRFDDLYICFELMDTDLAKLTKDETQCLTIPHVRWFLYQALLGLKYTHSARILHRDIKPANILLTEA
jgi:serine/threonine protein kinase